MNDNEKIEWLRNALIHCLDVMEQAECDLSCTPVEMTTDQCEELELLVADRVGDAAQRIATLGKLAGFDLAGDGRHTLNYAEALRVLRLIEESAGKTTEEGLTCSASWCAEQARAFLNTSNTAVSGSPAEPHGSEG
jgi:hypothetical protein